MAFFEPTQTLDKLQTGNYKKTWLFRRVKRLSITSIRGSITNIFISLGLDASRFSIKKILHSDDKGYPLKRQLVTPSITHYALMKKLEKEIDYHFSNQQLLIEALTHSSVALDSNQAPLDNERMEFLGDAVLQLIITRHLFDLFPDFHEGQLTKIRTRLVSRTALKGYAETLYLGKYLIMGRGEETSGGRERASILGDAFEALVGAIYLDGGIKEAKKFILKVAKEHLDHVVIEPEEINPKGHLQEHLQSLTSNPPVYELIEERGAAHLKYFRYRVLWEGKELGIGEGRSKKEAEAAAAADALKSLAPTTREKKSHIVQVNS